MNFCACEKCDKFAAQLRILVDGDRIPRHPLQKHHPSCLIVEFRYVRGRDEWEYSSSAAIEVSMFLAARYSGATRLISLEDLSTGASGQELLCLCHSLLITRPRLSTQAMKVAMGVLRSRFIILRLYQCGILAPCTYRNTVSNSKAILHVMNKV